MSEIEELKRAIVKLAKEIEELKRKKELIEKEISVHDPLGISAALEKALEDKEEGSLFVHAGLIKRKGEPHDWWNQNFTLEKVFEVSPKRIVKFISPLTNEQRVRILRLLLEGYNTVGDISKKTGLKGGELYHHLKELIYSGYIKAESRGVYRLTAKGEIALIMISGMAYWLEPMTEEEVEQSLRDLTRS